MQTHDNDQSATRHQKLAEFESTGTVAFPYAFGRTHSAVSATGALDDTATVPVHVAVAGRIMAVRRMGKASFCHIQDESGRIQIYLKKDDLENYDLFRLMDIGDIIGVSGFMFRTRTGEISVHAQSFELLCKCLVPIPVPKEETDEHGNRVVHDQFSDKELRYRNRYVDLTVNPQIRQVFRKRAAAIGAVRSFLNGRGYMEVETPVLHPMYGGAAARPFGTHMNALDIPLYLRISLELNLKRLIVGGFDGVYELGKNFRNEGLDRNHNPEFTMLELYVAYHDYNWMQNLIEDMITHVATTVNGSLQAQIGDNLIDFTPPFRRATMLDLIAEHTGENVGGMDLEELRRTAERLHIGTDPTMGRGKILDELFSGLVQPHLVQPVFVMDQPEEMVPLAKPHRSKPGLVESWELIVNGQELGPCFSELNDPRVQRKRFEDQAGLRAAGDDEAMLIDEDFLHALEVGMPPTAGVGIGIDRLVMILTGQESIRDVIFFPMMRTLPAPPVNPDMTTAHTT